MTRYASLCLGAVLVLIACSREPGARSVLRVEFDDTLAVQVRFPAGYDSTRAYPVLIGLHGRGGRARHFLKLWNTISRHDVIFLVPEAPLPFELGYAWFRNQTPDSARISRDRARSEEFIAAVARTALDRYGGEKAYLLGFSQGGNLAYHTALRYRGMFQGVITFGTYLDVMTVTPEKSRGAEGLKAYIIHGRKDRAIAYEEGEFAYQNLKNRGSQAMFRETPGGHEVDDKSLALALDWMLGESRNSGVPPP
jgi:phospholipase/carboxylesterase